MFDHAELGARSPAAGRTFFAILALVTVIPLVTLPFFTAGIPPRYVEPVMGAWVLTGFGHVTATLWFAADTEYRGVVLSHRWRMIFSLAIVPLVLGTMAITKVNQGGILFALFWFWPAHHYNRQNLGILAFAAAHDRAGPLPRQVHWLLNLTTVAGGIDMAVMPSIYPRGLPGVPGMPPEVAYYGHGIAALLFIAAAAVLVQLVATNAAVRRSRTLLVFLVLSTVYYLPGLIGSSDITAFWPIAMAHGAQYLVIMSITAGRSRRGLPGFTGMALATIALGSAGYLMIGVPWQAMYSGVAIWHFLADAKLWRLRDPEVRGIVHRRFDFIFTAPARLAPASALMPPGAWLRGSR